MEKNKRQAFFAVILVLWVIGLLEITLGLLAFVSPRVGGYLHHRGLVMLFPLLCLMHVSGTDQIPSIQDTTVKVFETGPYQPRRRSWHSVIPKRMGLVWHQKRRGPGNWNQ